MVFIKLLLLSMALVGIAMFGFMLKVIFKPKGQFPETRVGHNKEMRKRKIYCVKTQQKIIDKGLEYKERHQTSFCDGCA